MNHDQDTLDRIAIEQQQDAELEATIQRMVDRCDSPEAIVRLYLGITTPNERAAL